MVNQQAGMGKCARPLGVHKQQPKQNSDGNETTRGKALGYLWPAGFRFFVVRLLTEFSGFGQLSCGNVSPNLSEQFLDRWTMLGRFVKQARFQVRLALTQLLER